MTHRFEVTELDELERENDDVDQRLWLIVDGEHVAYQDFSWQDADYPDPCSWGELADAQSALQERIGAELLADHCAEVE